MPQAIPIIAAGIGAGGTVAAAKMGSNTQKNIAAQQQQAAQQAMNRANPAFDAALKYYQGLLSNDPATFMGAIGPDVQNTNQLFDSALKSTVEGAQSRSGGLDRALGNLQAGRAVSLSNLMSGVRPGAAAALGNLAGGQQVAGLNALAGSQLSAQQNALQQQQGLSGVGSFVTRLLSTPGLFGGGQQQQFVPQTATPPPAYMSPTIMNNPNQFFNPASGNPFA